MPEAAQNLRPWLTPRNMTALEEENAADSFCPLVLQLVSNMKLALQVQGPLGPKVVLSVLLKTGCSTRVEPSVFQTTTSECDITLQDGEPSSAVRGSAAACCISNCDFFIMDPPLATTTKHQFQCILKHVTPRKEVVCSICSQLSAHLQVPIYRF